ncbi:MAG: cache domain-containing protein [Bacteroidales bacterium]|nr:cache domain-containing protein [Bacteroidales bacterium]
MDKLLRKARTKFFLNIVLPSILAVILFVVSLFFIVIPLFENAMLDRKREMIAELTNTATSILEKYHNDEKAGLISTEEAQQTAISRIEYLRYGEENKDYFWITDMQPKMIVHPYRPDLNGKDLSNFEDSHGKKIFVECVKVVINSQHGYLEYMWQWKDDPSYIVPKLSYVKAFKPWGWIVGTGIYIEDVKAEIAGLTKRFIILSFIISALIILILFYIGRHSFNIERKRIAAEIELDRSRQKYRSLVDASTEGLIMLIDKQISYVNPVFEKLSGFNFAEILLKKIEELIEIPTSISKQITSDIKNIRNLTIETKILSNKEELHAVVDINYVDYYGKDALIFSVKDASLDKLVREELIYSREKFQTLMDKLNQGIFRTSMDTKGQFLEANQTALRIFGYNSFDEIKDSYILDFFVERQDKKTFRQNLLKQGFIKNQLVKLSKKSGEHIFAAVSLIVVYSGNEPKFCDGIIQDISTQTSPKTEVDNITKDYSSFMQYLFSPLNIIATKALTCNFDVSLYQLAARMNKASSGFVLITAESGEIIGYISDKIIRERAIIGANGEQQVYNFMSSPVEYMDNDSTIFDAINYYNLNPASDVLIIKNEIGNVAGIVNKEDLLFIYDFLPVKLLSSVAYSDDISDMKNIHDKYILSLLPLIDVGTEADLIFHNLSFISDLICRNLIEKGQEILGQAPAKFVFISLGSEGRREQTLNTDQDNAIVYADVPNDQKNEVKEYFDKLAAYVCDALDDVGYEFCRGGIMAKNPEYCQPVSVWKQYFNKWINTGTGKDLLDISVFFDCRAIYGETSFVTNLQEYVGGLTKQNPAYLLLLAQSNIRLKPQVGFWGNILLETAGAPPETVNIKEAIMPITNFARIYALKNNIREVSTIKRLAKLRDADVLTISSYDNITQAYKYLQMMRLKRQAVLIKKGINPDNLINTKHLSELDKTIIKKVLANINTMLSKLSFDFKGTL